jgi:cell wall assembly regulator SMI1
MKSILSKNGNQTAKKLSNITMRDTIIEKLKSSSLNDFTEGIELVREAYRTDKAALAMDQEIMERILGAMIYEKFYTHDELSESLDKVMEVLPRHISLMEDFINKYTLKGISIFVDQFIDHNTVDISGFMMAMGSPYLVVWNEANNMAGLIAENDKEGAEVMTAFAQVLHKIFEVQMSARSLLMDFQEWDKPTATALYNIIVNSDLDTQADIFKLLEDNQGNAALLEYAIDPYANTLAGLREKYLAEGSHPQAITLMGGYIWYIVKYIKTTKQWGATADRVKLKWDLIELLAERENPGSIDTFNEPVSLEEWKGFEKAVGVELPETLREFYLVHDGQDTGRVFNSGLLVEGSEGLFPLSKITHEWNLWNSLNEEYGGDISEDDAIYQVKPLYWNPLWIPLLGDGSGDIHFMDLDPTEDGKYGQIILRKNSGPEYRYVADSFEAWIDAYIEKRER